MDLEKLGEFIIPIVMLVLYFIISAKGKKKEPERARSEPPRDRPPPKRTISPERAPLHASPKIIPTQSLPTPLEKKVHQPSYASKLIKGRSLRQAFLMKEILNRPYE